MQVSVTTTLSALHACGGGTGGPWGPVRFTCCGLLLPLLFPSAPNCAWPSQWVLVAGFRLCLTPPPVGGMNTLLWEREEPCQSGPVLSCWTWNRISRSTIAKAALIVMDRDENQTDKNMNIVQSTKMTKRCGLPLH